MALTAATEPVLIVALISLGLLVAVIIVTLVAIARLLRQVAGRLDAIAAAANRTPPEAEIAQDALAALNDNLKAGQKLLEAEPDPGDAERQ